MSKAARPQGANQGTVRRTKPSAGGQGLVQNGGMAGGGILRFYTDDAPGLKIGPVSSSCRRMSHATVGVCATTNVARVAMSTTAVCVVTALLAVRR